jgi:hypothetical protein
LLVLIEPDCKHRPTGKAQCDHTNEASRDIRVEIVHGLL